MENYLLKILLTWFGGVGRLIDALVWLATLGWVKTQLNLKITQYGAQDWRERPWAKQVQDDSSTTYESGGLLYTVHRHQPHWLNFLLAAVLLADGLIQTLGLGFIESTFAAQLTLSGWWNAHCYTSVPLVAGAESSKKTVASKLRYSH